MTTYQLLGKDFTPPDVKAKVTGRAKYAEDFRVDGMVFCKLLTSPLPHARVTGVDASAALAMSGVHGVLTADDVPSFPAPQDAILTNEPVFVGQPDRALLAAQEGRAGLQACEPLREFSSGDGRDTRDQVLMRFQGVVQSQLAPPGGDSCFC